MNGKQLLWRVFAALAALLTVAPHAAAVAELPDPLEDVTKLEEPTISYGVSSQRSEELEEDEIRLVNLDGTNDRLWMRFKKEVMISRAAEWSPDGKRMAVALFDPSDNTCSPYALELESGKKKNLYHYFPKGFAYIHLAWSPNGRWLASIGSSGFADDIYKLRVDDHRLVRLSGSPKLRNWSPTWSPDGQKIAYTAFRDADDISTRDIVVADASDGGNKTALTSGADGYNKYPVWSPDGKWIAFTSFRDSASGRSEWAEGELYVMRPDGSNQERLTFDDALDAPYDWSPDGKWILYLTHIPQEDGSRVRSLNLMHIETREQRTVIQGDKFYAPRWVRAGQSRFLSVDSAGKRAAQWGSLKQPSGSEAAAEE